MCQAINAFYRLAAHTSSLPRQYPKDCEQRVSPYTAQGRAENAPSLPRKATMSGEDKTDKLVYPVHKGEKDGDGGVSLLVHPQTGRE